MDEAVVCARHRLSRAGLTRAVRRLAAVYAWWGITPGERIVCALGNRCEHVVVMAAAWAYGAVHVPADPAAGAAEITAIVERSAATAAVFEAGAERHDPFRTPAAVLRRRPGLRIVTLTHHMVPNDYLRWSLDGDGAPTDLPAVAERAASAPGAGLAHRLGLREEDVHLTAFPLCREPGLTMAAAVLISGGRLVLLDHFDPGAALAAVGAEEVSVVSGAPADFTLLLDRLDPVRHRTTTLRLGVGAAGRFPPKLVNAIWEGFGIDLALLYCSQDRWIATLDQADVLRGSVGRPEPGTVAVVGPGRLPLPAGETGEVAFAASDGWRGTGDAGRFDDDGRLYLSEPR
jgi:acyl-CoA synthetase (AMP-forming)/AMP-acid ligase II